MPCLAAGAGPARMYVCSLRRAGALSAAAGEVHAAAPAPRGLLRLHRPPKPASQQHLLASIVTDLDGHRAQFDLHPRDPHSASPTTTGPSSATRPGTAGPFAFSVPSVSPASSSTTPSSSAAAAHLSPNNNHHPPTSASSLSDRPYSSSGLHNNNPQTPAHHALAHHHHHHQHHHLLSSAPRASFPNPQPRSAHPSSPLPAPAQTSNCAVNLHQSRPMTAPGAAWVASHHPLPDALDFASAHLGLFGQASPYSLHPASLSAAPLAKTLSADFPSLRHPSPPGMPANHGSSAASSDPDSGLHQDPPRPVSPLRAGGPPAHSADSSPESPGSASDPDPALGYIHALPPSSVFHTLRPSTHAGTSSAFGLLDRRPHPQRPNTGYPGFFDPAAFNALQPFPSRPHIFPNHSSHIYAPTAAQYSHGPGALDAHDRLYNFNILPGAPRKRARRRFDEVERLYDCNYPGCSKAYGTLNHLNAHISMQKHGPKRLPQEFKEIRKEWRARKKAEAEARAAALKHPTPTAGPQEYASQDSAPQEYATQEYASQEYATQEYGAGRPPGLSSESSPASSAGRASFPAHFRLPPPTSGAEWPGPRAPAIPEHPEYFLPHPGDPHPLQPLTPSLRLHPLLPPASSVHPPPC
ncbi:hypothetical protein PTTG_27511 [Puccinia triticina 1-1 BBBD Race 1]|uniref:C2H2-type domain-containing protein n=1 Tax=Puccinia triticina (isolate 1-1 / race 1 (BBBD)) TaxID=630390 RepID=A0A180GJP0_PUCT1|nr:hypothetical protein PTTG_27511 [Puccinia triticina 1-1 BBBD Race 1]